MSIALHFSEDMDWKSLAGKVSVRAGGKLVPGWLEGWEANGRYSMASSIHDPTTPAVDEPVTLRVEVGAHAPDGRPFDPRAFDSPTDVQGAFELTVVPKLLPLKCGGDCWEWWATVTP